MENFYTSEVNVQILISLMKAHGIRKIIISPGTANVALSASARIDPYFQLFSSTDERSAAYMACGMAAESGEAVALSCTGATASRDYLPGLTEAYYRKLPILAITSSQMFYRTGDLSPQFIDRSRVPVDAARTSLFLPLLHDENDTLAYTVKVNSALLELRRGGGGPVHINLETGYNKNFNVKTLPNFPMIRRLLPKDKFPNPKDFGKCVAIFVGSHAPWSKALTAAVETFCAKYNGVVLCDHTSNYNGKYKILFNLLSMQSQKFYPSQLPELMIHIGEISGAYFNIQPANVWRVSPDGELRNPFKTLRVVFEMTEEEFFTAYANNDEQPQETTYYNDARADSDNILRQIPELPFSNIWLAQQTARLLPPNCSLHLAILNSLRSWNFFECNATINRFSNVGGFGIDGCASSLIGASLVNPKKLFFAVIGDLAFFYDMNSMGNRYVGNNLRILLVNNGCGTEFKMYTHYAYRFGDEANPFIAGAGHFGNQSPDLVKHYAQDLGFEYITASSKWEYLENVKHFVTPQQLPRSIIFEVFTNHNDESDALRMMKNIIKAPQQADTQSQRYFPKPPFFCGDSTFAGDVLNAFGQYEILDVTKQPEFDPEQFIVYFGAGYEQLKIILSLRDMVEGKDFMDGRQLFNRPQIPFSAGSDKGFIPIMLSQQSVTPKPKSNLFPPKKASLGFGVMRMPQLEDGSFDMQEAQSMIDEYMKGDFRYFDFHPAYCKQMAQTIIRELVVKRYPRNSFLLANKMPWPIHSPSDYERIFISELRECGVDYFDYYLLHALSDKYYTMHEQHGGFNFLQKLKEKQFVRRIGFSFHDKPEVLEKILVNHPEIDFVQLQINYLDWEDPFVQSRRLYEIAKTYGKQVTVMEPIKGGSLANLEKFNVEGGFDRKAFAAMALRFVASLDVSIILSGMSATEHVIDNRQTLEDPKPLSDDDMKIYQQIRDTLKEARQIPCTACRYCETECPKKIAIPDILSLLNQCGHTGDNDTTYIGRFKIFYRSYTQNRGKASDCIKCGKCANRCPQGIPIPEHMTTASETFENVQ